MQDSTDSEPENWVIPLLGQGWHSMPPLDCWYDPAGQGTQGSTPVDEMVPGWHGAVDNRERVVFTN